MNGERAYEMAYKYAKHTTDGAVVEDSLVKLVAQLVDFDVDEQKLNLARRIVARRKRPGQTPGDGLAVDLDHAELLLRAVQLLTADRFAGLDPALLHQLKTGLRTARIAIDGAKTPARRDLSSVAVGSTPAVATTGGPDRISGRGGKVAAPCESRLDRAGGPPAPGAGTFSLPQPPEFSIGAALL